ncbi:MAG: DISARM system phospholipase D-like protein DrmC [Candidatus Promineifilaceae bacterium]
MKQDDLVRQIQDLAADLPVELADQIAAAIEQVETADWPAIRGNILNSVTQTSIQKKLNKLLDIWQQEIPDQSPVAVALALRAAAETAEYYRQLQQLELVWTGPKTDYVPIRRTDQALLQLINEAQDSLQIVSFAVYKIERLKTALLSAVERGVEVSLYLETPEESDGRMSIDTVSMLGQEIADCVSIYIWPREQRETTPDGRVGMLHAKIALADGRLMLISSANLTEHAMTLNMEMGVLIRGGPLPAQVAAHLSSLKHSGVFNKLPA